MATESAMPFLNRQPGFSRQHVTNVDVKRADTGKITKDFADIMGVG
jgi:hypothetical protein